MGSYHLFWIFYPLLCVSFVTAADECDSYTITHATPDKTDSKLDLNEVVTYTCDSGYVAAPGYNIFTYICKDFGFGSFLAPEMDTLVDCVLAYCVRPQIIQYAQIQEDITPLTFIQGFTVNYVCDSGYVIAGSSDTSKTVTCTYLPAFIDAGWPGIPSCVLATIILQCDVPSDITNAAAMIRDTTMTWNVGDTVTYTCTGNYVIHEGLATLTRRCENVANSATWSASTGCTTLLQCGVLPAFDHAEPAVTDNKNTWDISETVQYTCRDHYVTQPGTGSFTVTCIQTEHRAQWSAPAGCLTLLQCAVPPQLPHAETSDERSTWNIGETTTYTCNDNYVVQIGTGSLQITCLNKDHRAHWSATAGCTTLLRCSIPSAMTHADLTTPTNTVMWDIGESLDYRCTDGYVIQPGTGTFTRTCEKINYMVQWSATPGCTQLLQCGPPPAATHALYERPGNKVTWTIGEMVSYICTDHSITHTGQAMYQETCVMVNYMAEWTASPGCITVLQCSAPSAIINAHPAIPVGKDAWMIGDEVTYSCLHNYLVNIGVSSLQRTCLDVNNTASWSNSDGCTQEGATDLSSSLKVGIAVAIVLSCFTLLGLLYICKSWLFAPDRVITQNYPRSKARLGMWNQYDADLHGNDILYLTRPLNLRGSAYRPSYMDSYRL